MGAMHIPSLIQMLYLYGFHSSWKDKQWKLSGPWMTLKHNILLPVVHLVFLGDLPWENPGS